MKAHESPFIRHGAGRWLAAAAALLLTVTGCASVSYGLIYQDPQVTRQFTTDTVPDYYRYYTIGRSDLPYAIIGIDPRYHLVTEDWQPVVPNSKAFAQKVAFIWTPSPAVIDRYGTAQGAWIKGPDGKKIGIWFSHYASTTVKLLGNNAVEIFPPENPSKE